LGPHVRKPSNKAFALIVMLAIACLVLMAARGVKLPQEIILTFNISADGKVKSQEVVKTKLGDQTLGTCLTKIVQGLVIANPAKKPVAVTAKLVL